ncbi:TPA: hypothetical protein DCZ36_03330, partial [Candidatus Gracilibacteria bacterium]|nr:hypothetical protein [Candidatus Gracilibacteria bacterium]
MSEQIKPHFEKQKLSASKEAGISFVETIEANRRYMQEQHKKGFVNMDQLEKFEKFAQESLEKYGTSAEEATKHFNEGRENVLRDTGIELSKERVIADFQLQLYYNHSIDRYTYKNQVFGQFRKGLIDGLIVGNYELVVMLKEHGSEVLTNLFSMETVRHMVSSLGESFVDVLTGDAYMKGKSIIAVILSTMGATAFLNLISRGALKAGISSMKSGVKRKISDAYTIHTPKIDALNLTSGRSFPKPQGKIVSYETSSVAKNTSVVTSAGVVSQTVASPEKITSHTASPEKIPHGIHLPKNTYEIHGNTLLLRSFSDISEAELEISLNLLIRDNNIKTLRLDSSISHDAQRQVANIVMRNHPLFEMMRLVHGNDVVNVTFGGIKDLNDLLGQKFVDDFVGGAVRREIITRFDTYSKGMMEQGQKSHNRLVRNDYKNLTPSFEGGTFS